jgi:hypothetical protein
MELPEQSIRPVAHHGALVSFLTWSVGLWNHRRREESEHREAIKKLDFEIPFRFSKVQHSLDQAQRIAEPEKREGRVKDIVDHLRMAPGTNDPALNPDYNGFTLPGLVAELHRHIEALGGNDTDELERVLGHLAGLETFFQQANASYSALYSDPKKIGGAIAGDLWLSRWRHGSWYYVEGSREKPFP